MSATADSLKMRLSVLSCSNELKRVPLYAWIIAGVALILTVTLGSAHVGARGIALGSHVPVHHVAQDDSWSYCSARARDAIEGAAASQAAAGGWNAFHGKKPEAPNMSDSQSDMQSDSHSDSHSDSKSDSQSDSRDSFQCGASIISSMPRPGAISPPWSGNTNDEPDLERPPVLAVTTTNVWAKTQLLLHSLAAVRDPLELLVVDELSSDGTVGRLTAAGITMIRPKTANGVTFNWNLAYQKWKRGVSPYLFISNNDVLMPDGSLTALTRAMTPHGGDCDLVAPLSTVLGKGFWAKEGAENLLNLSKIASAFVQQPLHYQLVQDVLTACACQGAAAVRQNTELHQQGGFSGFFFGLRRSTIEKFIVDDQHLFSSSHRNIGQEHDLSGRIDRKGGKICLHTAAWMFHYKASTLATNLGQHREEFVVKTKAEKQQQQSKSVAKSNRS